MQIPIIDLTDALTSSAPRRQAVAQQIRDAAETCSFFYVSQHGIPQPLIDRQFAAAAQFFRLPADAKQALALQPGGPMRGYEAVGSQTLDDAANADLKESFQCGRDYSADHRHVLKGYSSYGPNPWPAGLPKLREASQRYFDAMAGLSATLLELLALSLDLPETYFARLNANPSDTLRLLWYPPQPAMADARTFGAGANTDWGALTILAQDANGGLEVQLQDGVWGPADPIEATFVINLGDMIPRWTNGRYHSNFHRVINKNPAARHRQSVVFFTDLDFEALIEPIPSAMGDNRPPLAEPCTVGEHMAEMVRMTYGQRAAMNVTYTIQCKFYQSLFEWPDATNFRTPIFRALSAHNLLFGFHAPMVRSLLNLADADTPPFNDRGFPTVEVPRTDQVNEIAERAQVLGGKTVKAPFPTYYGQWQTVFRNREAIRLSIACLELPIGTRSPTVVW